MADSSVDFGVDGRYSRRDFDLGFEMVNGKFSPHTVAIHGDPQSQKTSYIIKQSFIHITRGSNVAIVLRNVRADMKQLLQRFERYILLFKQYLSKKGKVVNVKLGTVSSLTKTPLKNTIIMCLCNPSQLSKLLPYSESFVIFVDEADFVAIPTDRDCTKSKSILQEIIPKSMRTVLISATMFDVLTTDLQLTADTFRKLPVPENYKGIKDYGWEILHKDCKPNKVPCTSDEFADSYLYTYFDGLQQRKRVGMPVISLVLITTKVKPQHKLARYICSSFPGLHTIVHDGRGITVYTRSLERMSAALHTKISKGSLRLKHSLTHQNILTKFRELGITKNIVILGGTVAGRSISYVCTNGLWRVSEGLMLFPRTTTIPELVQKAARGCGVISDPDFVFTLYTTQSSCEKIKKGVGSTDEVLQSTLKLSSTSSRFLDECVNEVSIYSGKLPGSGKLGKGSKTVKVSSTDSSDLLSIDEYCEKYSINITSVVRSSKSRNTEHEGGVRVVDEEFINSSTEYAKTYQKTCEYFKLFDKVGKWENRVHIVNWLCETNTKRYVNMFNSELTTIATKMTRKGCEEDTGLKFQKLGNVWKLSFS